MVDVGKESFAAIFDNIKAFTIAASKGPSMLMLEVARSLTGNAVVNDSLETILSHIPGVLTAVVLGVTLGSTIFVARNMRLMKGDSRRVNRVPVGVAVVVIRPDGMILVGKRKGSAGSGEWAFPGGWLQVGESFLDCAFRELEEETGLLRSDVSQSLLWDIAPKHNPSLNSVSVFTVAWIHENSAARVCVKEPNKCYEWKWIAEECSKPLFPPLEYILNQKREHLRELVMPTTK